jgi:putative inorganic carbon (HCO3(-)) transporter
MAGSLSPGFNPNEVGGTLTFFIPLVASLLSLGFFGSRKAGTTLTVMGDDVPITWRARGWLLPGLLAAGLVFMGGTLILTQSRSAFLGIGAALLVLMGFRRSWFGTTLALLAVVGACYYFGPQEILNSTLAVGSDTSTSSRFEVWQRALYMIGDFAYTGVGLNGFSTTANVLYPLFTLPPERVLQITHAHNVFLQVAVDLGIPGLVAYLSLLLGFGAAWWTAYRHFAPGPLRAVSVGLLCGMVAYHIYGITDCITLGAKPGVALWAMMGLMVALVNLSLTGSDTL